MSRNEQKGFVTISRESKTEAVRGRGVSRLNGVRRKLELVYLQKYSNKMQQMW